MESNIYMKINQYGSKEWFKDDVLHRDNDLPARITTDGSMVWIKEGNATRDNDLPAVVKSDRSMQWYKDNKLHRTKGPAIVRLDTESKDYYEKGRYKYTDLLTDSEYILYDKMWKEQMEKYKSERYPEPEEEEPKKEQEDFDSFTGFWIEGAPYLWVPGDSPQSSKRYYILHLNASAVFDSNNLIMDVNFFSKRLNPDPSETFSLFPIAHKKDCGIVRNHFLVWLFNRPEFSQTSTEFIKDIEEGQFPLENVSVRIEGKPIDILHRPPLFKNDMITIINPDTEYRTQVASVRWEFGNPHVIKEHGGVKGEIILQGTNKKPRKFQNILTAKKILGLNVEDIKLIHVEALKNAFVKSVQQINLFNADPKRWGWRIDNEMKEYNPDIIANELTSLGSNIPDVNTWNPETGWIYKEDYISIVTLRILYEIAIGKRQNYELRETDYGLKPKPKTEQISSFFKFDPQKESKKQSSSSSSLLDKKATIYTTTDIKKRGCYRLEKDDSVCFFDNPNKKYRKTMEDQAFEARLGPNIWIYAVLDGHGGSRAAEYFMKSIPTSLFYELRSDKISDFTLSNVKKAVKKAFLYSDSRWFHGDTSDQYSGTTFTGILVTPHNIFTINLGDSRSLILQGDELHTTKDHKPKNIEEKKRIEKAGLFVKNNRVNGDLAVSRALGDNDFKTEKDKSVYLGENAPVSPVPDVEIYERKGDELVLIACDGVFDVMSNEQAMEIFVENKSCKDVVEKALRLGTTDNVSVMGIKLLPPH